MKMRQPEVDRFFRSSRQVGRDAFCPPLELPLMEEMQARPEKGEDRCRIVHLRWKGCSRSRFVVVFQKTCRLALEIKISVQMLAHRTGVPLAKAVVQPFVESVIEPLLLDFPLQVSVETLAMKQKPETRSRTRCVAGLPDAQQPEPVKTQFGNPIQLGVCNIVQVRTFAERARAFRQPNSSVELVAMGNA